MTYLDFSAKIWKIFWIFHQNSRALFFFLDKKWRFGTVWSIYALRKIRGDPRGISPGGTPGKIVFLIPPFPGENFPIPRGKLNKKIPEKVIFFYVISLFFTFCYIFGHLWFQICLIATLYLSSGEYFHTLKVFADNEKFDQISDGEKWIEKL